MQQVSVNTEKCRCRYIPELFKLMSQFMNIDYMGHKIPISMTYLGSGVRPDQHPGWVGLGWNLNAGGCISRIVNGLPDETYRDKF